MRRAIEIGSALVAVIALGLVLYNATLVDRRPPNVDRIALSLPAGDAHRGQTLTAIDIEFSEPVQSPSVESRFRLDPYVPGTFAWNGNRTAAIFTPSARLTPSTHFTVRLDAGFEDLAGNAASATPDPFVFDTVGPPTVMSTDPPDGASQVPVDRKLKITFDRLMDTGAVEAALRIDPDVAHQASWSGPVLTLSFPAPLQFGTSYTITVGEGAVDTDGSHLGSASSTTFTTVAAGLAPVTTVPAPNVAGASIRGPIGIVFDAPIDPASIADSLRITPSVAGSISVSSLPDDSTPITAPISSPSAPIGRVLLFTPSGQLAPHTTYTVSLSATVRRLDDPGQVAAARTWAFTTGQATSSAQNQVAFLSARAGVRNLWLMNPDGSNPRQITSELVPLSGYDVSPDGGTIAYSAGGLVHVVRVDGSDARTVTTSGHWDYSPTFSPDARSVLVARRGTDGGDLGFWLVPLPGAPDNRERQVLPTGAPAVDSVGLDGDGLLPTSGTPPWFRRAAFGGDTGVVMLTAADGHLWIVDTQPPASPPEEIELTAETMPVWDSTDLSFIVAGRRPAAAAAEPGIWRVRPTGLITRVADGTGPVASDGKGGLALLAGSGPGGSVDPLRMAFLAPGGTAPLSLTSGAGPADRWPAFAPNGDLILFLRVSTSAPDRSEGIWVIQPDGRQLRQLSTDGSYPRWPP